MIIPNFPDFVPVSLELKKELHPHLSLTPDGVSEYTFSNMYLFRNRYQYRVARIKDCFVISGIQPAHAPGLEGGSGPETGAPGGTVAAVPVPLVPDGAAFFMTPCAVPEPDVLAELFRTHSRWKGISKTVLEQVRDKLEGLGIGVDEDRDNFDYLYRRSDLAELAGKKYHKKRNLVSAFLKSCANHEEVPFSKKNLPDALAVLDRWREDKGEDGDYRSCREMLDLWGNFRLRGLLYYIDGKPAGWCLGESIARGRMFTIHFEKAIDAYKGIYQFINQSFAAALPGYYTHINREQDLGDPGLRQAKMTYRPSGFVEKYVGRLL
jgi:hypothetical protein